MPSAGSPSTNVIDLSCSPEPRSSFVAVPAYVSVPFFLPLVLFSSPFLFTIFCRHLSVTAPFKTSLHDWKWLPGWKIHLNDPYREVIASGMAYISASVVQRECRLFDGFVLFLDLNANEKVLQPLSVFQYAADFSDSLDAWGFVLGMCNERHDFYMTSQRRSMLTAAGAWLHCWISFGGREAAWLQCAGSKASMCYDRRAEEKTMSVLCIGSFTVFAAGLMMVTFRNQTFIQAWTWYVSTILFPTTGSCIVWIILIFFWTSSTVLVSVGMLPAYL